MTHSMPCSEDIDSLMADVLHGTASASEVGRLEAMLVADATLRTRYLDQALLHAQLAATPVAAGVTGRTRLENEPLRLAEAARVKSATGGHPLPMAAGQLLRGGLVLLAAAAVLTLMVLPPQGFDQPATAPPQNAIGDGATVGGYDNRQLPAETVGLLTGRTTNTARPLLRTTLTAGDAANRLTTTSGAAVEVDTPGLFGLISGGSGALFRGGARARLSEPEQTYTIESGNLRVVDLGTEFRVNRVDDDHLAVTVLDGEVEVQSRVRLPLVHWSFADFTAETRASTDAVHGLRAVAGSAVKRTTGAVGGSVGFDNSPAAFLRVEGGTGEKVGTGLLSFSTGISIEALIVPAWNGEAFDYDEIWRKEDGNSRVLLSFQNDSEKNGFYSVPAVEPGPCLSFGLQLTQPGAGGPRYDELDLPLDGREGRPSLAELIDGQPHHVVATFDSFNGVKAIFIDGSLRFSHRYPEGSLIVSGGPAAAFIGSNRGGENFTGSIDELSLYAFALSPDEVADHHRRLLNGKPAVPEAAFAPAPQAASLSENRHWQAVTRLVAGESRIFNQRTGFPID